MKFFFFLKLIINQLIIIPFYIPAFFVNFFIRLLHPIVVIRFGQLSRRIGHFTANAEIILCERKLKKINNTKKTIDIFCVAKVPNIQIAKMYKRAGIYLAPFYIVYPIIKINKLLPYNDAFDFNESKFSQSDRDIDHLFDKINTQISFISNEISESKKILKSLGVNENKKIICLMIRDDNYLREYLGGNWNYHDYRNYKLENFYPAIRELLNKGYIVFRMGKFAKERININHKNFFDYPFLNQKSDLLEVYLSSICEFCVTTSSGFDAIPYIFRKPLAILHVPVGIFWTFNKKYITITKHHYSKDLKRNLTLHEIFKSNLAYALKTSDFSDKNIELIDNSSDEILNLVIEMHNYIQNKNISEQKEKIRLKFQDKYAYLINKYPHKRLRHGKILSNISYYFIENNKNWLD